MSVKLILSDIDGTILPWGHKVVSERTRAAFHAAMDAGLVVGPASGRFHSWIPAFFDGDEACCATAIATNGLQVYCRGEKVLQKGLDPVALGRAMEVLRDVPGTGLIFFHDGVPHLVHTRALVARLNDEVDGLDFDVPQPMFSNVMPCGWNKGAAFAWLCDYLGVARDEAVVFGDAGNDLALFEQAEHSVAVAGAMPEAKAAARWHIGACEDDAVAAAIEALAAGEWPFSE